MIKRLFSKKIDSKVFLNAIKSFEYHAILNCIKSFEYRTILDSVKLSDYTKIISHKFRNLQEHNNVNGYVTIIKNKGRKDEIIIQENIKNLLTISGRDFFHAQDYTNTSAGTKGGNAIALSLDATNPAAGDTTLVGEITADGLTRVQASTISHTVGTNVTTLENTFTATAAFVNLHKSALFNQNTIGGQITHSSEFTSDVTLGIGDTITVTWTLTLG